MKGPSVTTLYRTLLITLALAAFTANTLWAQATLTLSRQPDFSTNDRLFAADDTLFILATAPGIDVTAVARSTYEIEPAGQGTTTRGTLTNHLDSTFSAAVAASNLQGRARTWKVKVRIEDASGRTYEARAFVHLRDRGDEPELLTLVGTVASASATEITLDGQTVRLDAQTRVHVAGDPDPRPADLVGKTVVVLARREGEVLVAVEIVVRGMRPAEMALRGPVRRVTDSTVTVAGITFVVDAATRLEGPGGEPIALGDVAVGAMAEVKARRTEGGDWLATEISLRMRHGGGGDDHQVEGAVDSVGTTYVVVGGLRFEVGPLTRFEGVRGLAALRPGTPVEVRFVTTPDGSRLALKIEVEEGDDAEREVEVEGTVTALTATTISVTGLTFTVTGDTRIEGRGDTPLALADLATGMRVEVKGVRLADGSLVARTIEVEDDDETELDVRGRVTAVTDSSITIGTTPFAVTDSTVIVGRGDRHLPLEAVEVGMFAHAELVADAAGRLTALRVRLDGHVDRDEVEVTGLLRAVAPTALTVGRYTFGLDAATQLFDRDGNPVALSALRAGLVVRVKGVRQPGGTLVATEVHLRSHGHHEGTIAGLVSAVEGDTAVVVAGTRFRVGDQTIFRGVAGLDGVEAGQRASVHYRVLADGTRLALRLTVHPDQERTVVLRGPIETLEADALVVAGARVAITAQTGITDRDGDPLPQDSLAVGQTVGVHAVAAAGGLQAVRIQVKEALTVSAAVEARTATAVTVAGTSIVLTDETLVVGVNNRPLSLDDVRAGAFVSVLAVSGDDAAGTLTAARIEVAAVALGTDDTPDAPEVPAGFALHANYPNPFNPTTTITFDLLQGAAAEVSLVVFDVLGRQVRVLADGRHEPGRHTIAWDGRDALGRPVASGTYLYRLRVGDGVTTRTMTLIK